MKKSLHVQITSRKTDGTVALSFVIILLIVAWAFMTGGSEPRYQGRALSMWLVDLDANTAGNVRERAKIVLTEAARKAAPRFIQTLRAKDSDFKLLMIGLARRQGMAFGFRTADERREKAVGEFSRFSVGAIPVVTDLLDDPALAVQATRTLGGTGLAGAVPLIRALNHTNASVRMHAALGLSSLYSNNVRFKNLVQAPGWSGNFPTNVAVAAIVKLLKDESPDARASAAFALGDMREQPESVIPALTECLAETTDSQVRQAVAEALGRYGRRAIAAVSLLSQLMDDSDPALRTAAERALKKIDAREQNDRKEMNN
ncbi:MAG: HEAT repeat domain-containing protein [Verrucomicrobiota bacterium]